MKKYCYDRDYSIENLREVYEEMSNDFPKISRVNIKDCEHLTAMMEEIEYFIDLKVRDKDLEEREII